MEWSTGHSTRPRPWDVQSETRISRAKTQRRKGQDIADLEAGREEPWKQYPFLNASLEYVPNEPFRWLAAQSGLAWYRLTEP